MVETASEVLLTREDLGGFLDWARSKDWKVHQPEAGWVLGKIWGGRAKHPAHVFKCLKGSDDLVLDDLAEKYVVSWRATLKASEVRVAVERNKLNRLNKLPKVEGYPIEVVTDSGKVLNDRVVKGPNCRYFRSELVASGKISVASLAGWRERTSV